MVEPTASMSIVISASSASDVSEMTAAVAAVVVVFSDASNVSFVERIVVPLSLISTVNNVPPGFIDTPMLRRSESEGGFGAGGVDAPARMQCDGFSQAAVFPGGWLPG